ncbi:MAG: type II toxin-antitoxin system RelE/ParE family toxin [Myxococcales bacterium]|nr:type II toxin-antitoxin system RelE/ParE family toxin [Myxococcales bacterium]
MARVVYAANALANLEHRFAFVATRAPDAALAAVEAIRGAVEMLAHHPLIGRRVKADLRELVISFGHTGYVALYRFEPSRDEVRVLAIRHQRELDYPG